VEREKEVQACIGRNESGISGEGRKLVKTGRDEVKEENDIAGDMGGKGVKGFEQD